MAIDQAINDVKSKKNDPIPTSLKDAHYKGASKLGHGVSYIYPHSYPNDWVAQQYLPDNLRETSYFSPKGNSKFEQALKNQYEKLRKMQSDGLKNNPS